MPSSPIDPTQDSNAAAFSSASDDVFARIASRYDVLCDAFSLGAHRLWKRRMARQIARTSGAVVLDVASGTGDIPLRVLRHRRLDQDEQHILVTDICPQMLALARAKIGSPGCVAFALADAHDLADVPSGSVDVFSISFAMKICDRTRVMSEAARVLKPGGVFLCLEAARIPVQWLHRAYLVYMDWCLPTIARLVTGGDPGAYDYLLRGIHNFPTQHLLSQELEAHGFRDVRHEDLTFGIVALHRAVKR